MKTRLLGTKARRDLVFKILRAIHPFAIPLFVSFWRAGLDECKQVKAYILLQVASSGWQITKNMTINRLPLACRRLFCSGDNLA